MRRTGDVSKIAALQQFVWEAADRGNTDVHPLSNPSQSELLHEQFKKRKETLKKEKQVSVLQKYGGEEHLEAPDRQLLLGESEAYAEYAQTGEVIKGQEKAIPKTKYVEDVLENNHSEIWGSYFKDGKWGYSCCQQTFRNTYCTGETGRAIVNAEIGKERLLPPVPVFSTQLVPTKEESVNKKRKASDEATDLEAPSSKNKQKRALKKEKKRLRKEKEMGKTVDVHEIPTAAEMEEYHKRKPVDGDPMADFVDTTA